MGKLFYWPRREALFQRRLSENESLYGQSSTSDKLDDNEGDNDEEDKDQEDPKDDPKEDPNDDQ